MQTRNNHGELIGEINSTFTDKSIRFWNDAGYDAAGKQNCSRTRNRCFPNGETAATASIAPSGLAAGSRWGFWNTRRPSCEQHSGTTGPLRSVPR
jgi:hypothetical protein